MTRDLASNRRLARVAGAATLGLLCSAFLVPIQLTGGPGPAPTTPGVGQPGGPLAGLTVTETARFLRGRAVFDRNFGLSDGLGSPEMNADSCRACHQDPVLGGAGGLELNVSRFGDDQGGTAPFVDVPGGQGLSKLYPPTVEFREEYDRIVGATDYVFEQRQTPMTLGLGLVSAIYDAEILALEDPLDADQDGIFGVARLVDVNGTTEIGKLGWKAQLPVVADFLRDAMLGECGITTPDDGRGLVPNVDGDTVGDPELSQADFDDAAFFLMNLAPPARKGSTDPEVAAGEVIFDSIGCAKCHVPTLNGARGPVNAYSNFLLHDVMPPGFRGMSEPGAGVGLYRTAPLWGIGDTAPYMHDGRAEDLDGAIRAHFSEADAVRMNYENLNPSDQQALITFLEDL
jgi:CxxC motif-containing protein (DUF1111 family)